MSGTTQITLIVTGVAAGSTLIAAVVGALLTGRLDWRNTRRAAHEPAVAAARLIRREMELVNVRATSAVEQGLQGAPLSSSEWTAHKVEVAGRLSEEESLVLDSFYAFVEAGSVVGVSQFYPTAIQAIAWLAAGQKNAVKPRKTEISLAPRNMELPCRCGHIFGHHGWRAEKRRVRFRRRDARYKDVGYECKQCECQKFDGVGRLMYR